MIKNTVATIKDTIIVIINVYCPSAFVVIGIFINAFLKLLFVNNNNITNKINVFFNVSGIENENPIDDCCGGG